MLDISDFEVLPDNELVVDFTLTIKFLAWVFPIAPQPPDSCDEDDGVDRIAANGCRGGPSG